MHCLVLPCSLLMVWYNKIMAIFSDYPAQEIFEAEQPLDGAKFIDAIKYRIVSQVPDNSEGELGDVVYVMGSTP